MFRIKGKVTIRTNYLILKITQEDLKIISENLEGCDFQSTELWGSWYYHNKSNDSRFPTVEEVYSIEGAPAELAERAREPYIVIATNALRELGLSREEIRTWRDRIEDNMNETLYLEIEVSKDETPETVADSASMLEGKMYSSVSSPPRAHGPPISSPSVEAKDSMDSPNRVVRWV